MTAEEQSYEEERLHDQFTLLLQDLETYLLPITTELDAVLRYSWQIIFLIIFSLCCLSSLTILPKWHHSSSVVDCVFMAQCSYYFVFSLRECQLG